MNWLFYLDDLEIEEPIGIDDIELSLKRDDKMHGMTFEASTSPLEFYGSAFNYLKEQKETYGVLANVRFRALATCDNYDYEEIISGRLNFGKYKDHCGDQCTVSIPLEQESCEIVLKSRYDQKVDLDNSTGVDGITPLPDYAGLRVEKELSAHDLLAATEGYVTDEGDSIDLDIFTNLTANFSVRPTYGRQVYANINESQLLPSVFAASDNGFNDSVLSPVLLYDDNINCFDGNFPYEGRLKGSYNYNYTFGNIEDVRLIVAYGEYPGSLTILHQQALSFSGGSAVGTFDFSFSGNINLPQGAGFYAYFNSDGAEIGLANLSGSVTFDKETYIKITGIKSCPATTADLYFVHEAISRITEAVTNGCVRAKSSYYGRTDSEPFSFDEDGCGGLRSVTSGLKIRKAVDGKYFDSVKNLVEGLNAIDNIGMAVEEDPDIPGKFVLVIEGLDYFYRNEEILRHDYIPKSDTDTEETRHYSKIDVGYKKWEVENVNGLDEIHSTRQYNTSIDTLNSTLDITSNLVAGSYPIEITRQQSFAATGAADTKFDNETFILCMTRTGYLYSSIEVDKGNITNGQNLFSPSTIYNYRISPIRNLMRWYKSIAAGFIGLANSFNRLFFSSGTGNFQAKGMMTDPECRLENAELQENQHLFVTNFANQQDYTPLWKNEQKAYEYPMSVKDYKAVKANPYGYIAAQCGNDDFLNYWIKEIKFKVAKGVATFILRRKY